MDTTLNTTLHPRRVPAHRRTASAPRRAFLDNYAYRRGAKLSPRLHAPQVAVAASPVKPVASPKKSADIPVAAATHLIVAQATATQPQPVKKTAKKLPQGKYLDGLMKTKRTSFRPQQHAVSESKPKAMFKPSDSAQTESRIQANLQALYGDQSLTSQLENSKTSASISHIRTIAASALMCGVLSVTIFAFMGKINSQPVVAQPINAPIIEVESSNTRTPTGTAVDTATNTAPQPAKPTDPDRLVISSIGVNAQVESLGQTTDGLIAVPASYGLVGWYNKGSTPGEPGPTVLVGHYTSGNGGVFDKLDQLNTGDLVTTTNNKRESITYKVTNKTEYDRDKVPMSEIFKKTSDSRLQIITCAGKWQTNNYNKRLVITAEIVQ